jgi:hypothetical protein
MGCSFGSLRLALAIFHAAGGGGGDVEAVLEADELLGSWSRSVIVVGSSARYGN